MLHGGNAVGHAIAHRVILVRQQVIVAVPAGDAHGRAADQHPRPWHVSGVDGVAQRHIAESVGAHVAHRGEPGQQREPRVLGAGERFSRDGDSKFFEAKLGIVGQVGVRVNQAGQHGRVRQIDAHRVGGNLRVRRGAGAHNSSVFDYQRLVGEQLPGFHIEQMAGVNHDVPRSLRDPLCPQAKQSNCHHSSADLPHHFPFPQIVGLNSDSSRAASPRRKPRPQTARGTSREDKNESQQE